MLAAVIRHCVGPETLGEDEMAIAGRHRLELSLAVQQGLAAR